MPELHKALEILQRPTHKPDLARVVGAAKLALRIALQHIDHGLEVDEFGRLDVGPGPAAAGQIAEELLKPDQRPALAQS